MAKFDPVAWEARLNAAMLARKGRMDAKMQWFGKQVMAGINLTLRQRITVAAMLLRDATVINLSRPVRKQVRKSKRRVWTNIDMKKSGWQSQGRKFGWVQHMFVDPASRSKPGEFPRADTTRLMRDIFFRVSARNVGQAAIIEAIVGTTLDYGVILEVKRNRSFLVRTFNEQLPVIRNLLLGSTRP